MTNINLYEEDLSAIETLNEIAGHEVCKLCDKKAFKADKYLYEMEQDKLKGLIVRRLNKYMQLINATFYQMKTEIEFNWARLRTCVQR